jgi:hypothetical protein|tara:strand:+ start:1665 stop:2414 length:750 start_codon:yes stop_codon:yes gene_type:complete
MRRSEINALIREGADFIMSRNIALPPQAYWDLEYWRIRWKEDPVRTEGASRERNGWDITDFGHGDYQHLGLLLYTSSNGILGPDGQPVDQTYANKYLVVGEGQITPMHHHLSKIEDIICLSGGDLQIQVYNVGEDNALDTETPVRIKHDGCFWEEHNPEYTISMKHGQRVRLETHHYHKFWGKPGTGTVLVEETSMVNDDEKDNQFLPEDKIGRFPSIEEDEMPKFLLCTELPGSERFRELVFFYLGSQ